MPPVPRPRPSKKSASSTTDATVVTDGGDIPPVDPVADTPPADRPPVAPKAKPRANSLEARLSDFLSIAAVPFATVGDSYSATIIAQRTPALATNLAELAKENSGIKRALEKMLEGGAWGGVALTLAAIVIPIAQNYGAVPGDDPFFFMYPDAPQRKPRGIASPPAGFDGWSGGAAIVPPPPAPPIPGMPPSPPAAPSNSPDEPPQYLKDAPPGVVTVAATRAGHIN